MFAGGLNNSIYYQVVEYNDENIEKGGKSYIYQFDADNKKPHKKMIALEEKLIFISGGEDSIITSDYIYEPPFYDSGKLYLKDNDKWLLTTIPHVTAGYDIIGAEKINDKILLIYNNKSFYLYDFYSKKYMKKTYRNEHATYSRLKTLKNAFFYLEKADGKYYLHEYRFINSN